MKKYDVIIVGAGVSGLMLANLLNSSKLKVLLLEKKKWISSEPKTFGTFTKTAKEHGLEKFIDKYFDTWAFYGPSVKAFKTEKKIMCLVNYAKWGESLNLKRVDIKTGVILKKAEKAKGGIVLSDEKKSYFGRLVVDSSGYSQAVKKLLKFETLKETGLSYEVELDNCNLPVKNEASFILNFNVSNSGGWIYAISEKKAQYGWADFYPESGSDLKNLKERTLKAMKKVYPNSKWFKDSKVKYSYGRFGPTGSAKHTVSDNFISIGDAGGVGTPVTLEGFREAVDSAKISAEVILKSKDCSKEELQLFLNLFYEKYGKYYRMHKLVRHAYLYWMRNKDIDRWLANFNKLGKEDFFKLIKGELDAKLMLKTLDFALLTNLFLNMLNNSLPAFMAFRKLISASKKEVINEVS